MSFTPVIPMGGYGGWTFLQRTMQTQSTAFQTSATMQRDEEYFRANIGKIGSAEELVGDRRLMKVALGAFGLDADIDNKFFIRKVMEDGTLDPAALGNRLADKQYLALSKAFGFGDTPVPNTKMSDFADKILTSYKSRQFEIAVGAQNSDMRIAMNAQRELPALAAKNSSEDAKWFNVLGSEPLRQLFQTAFGLPKAFGSIDIDQQLGVMKDKAASLFGDSSVDQFADPEKADALIRRFLAISQTQSAPATSPALQLLQRGQGGGSSILSIIAG